MKNLYPVLFIVSAFLASTFLFSCSSPKVGFFNNTNTSPYVKAKEDKGLNNHTSAGGARSIQKVQPLSPVMGSPVLGSEVQNITINASEEVKTVEKNTVTNTPLASNKISKEQRKEVKKYIKENLKRNDENRSDINILLLVIIAILLPPLAVFLVDGLSGPFWLSILLWLLFYVPGLIYALYRIFKK